MRWACLSGLVLFTIALPLHAAEDLGNPSNRSAELDANILSKPPRLIQKATPEFPPAALEKQAEAEIKLLLDVDDKGQVSGVMVIEPRESTGLGFEEAATMAAYKLGFEPAEIEGKAVAVQLTYTFKFIPPKPAAPPQLPVPVAAEPAKPAAAPPTPVKNFAGNLRERGTRIPLSATLVTVYRNDGPAPAGFECISDKEGNFSFFDLAPGTWKVLIEAPGYYPFRTTEEIRPGELTQVSYFVEKGSYNPFDVLVEAPRPRKEVTRVVIDSAVIDKVPGAMGDPLAALQNYAGVGRVSGMEGEIIIRGSAPKDTKVFVDGVEIPIAYHFQGMRSVLPTGMIDSLEFYPGNFSPYYSRAIGGVIDVTLKKPKSDRWNGYLDVNLLDSGFFLEAPITDKLTLSLAARRSYMDFIINAVMPDDSPIKMKQAPVYYDYQFLANYRPAPAHDLRLFIFGSDDRFAMLFKNPGVLGTELTGNQLSLSTHFERGVLSYRYVPGENFDNTVRLSVGRDRFDQVVAQYMEHLYCDSIQLRDTARWKLSKSITLIGGVDSILQHWTAAVRMPMPPREGYEEQNIEFKPIETTADEYHWLPGAFAEVEIQPTSKLLLIPSLRFDYFSKIEAATLAPRLSARYTMNKQWTLKGAVGLYYQEPTVDESNKDFGNPLLGPERAIHYSAGMEWKPLPTLSVDVTGFYKDLDHVISKTSATRSENGQEVALNYDNNGVGRVVGMELVVRRDPIHRLSGWLAYTLSRSERRDSGSTSYRLFQFDQTHILTAVGMLRLPRNWQISTRFRLVSGNPVTPIVGAVNNLDSNVYKPTFGAQYSSRNPMFAQWDIRFDKKWVYDHFLLNAYIDFQNITNRSNIEEPMYSYDYRQSSGSIGMPIYPIIGLRGEF